MFNGMQDFGSGPAGGSMVSGKWMHKQTGAPIFVRDAIMQGDEMIVITDRGQLSGEDFSRNYIQMSDEEYDMKGNVINSSTQKQQNSVKTPASQQKASSKQQVTPMPQMPQMMPQIGQDQMFDTEFDEQYKAPVETKIESESEKLIKKLFSKIDSKPEISIDIKWADFPKNELSMLMNMFDVTKDDIASYMRSYLDDEAVKASIGRFLDKML